MELVKAMLNAIAEFAANDREQFIAEVNEVQNANQDNDIKAAQQRYPEEVGERDNADR